jgi:hypothetical protein
MDLPPFPTSGWMKNRHLAKLDGSFGEEYCFGHEPDWLQTNWPSYMLGRFTYHALTQPKPFSSDAVAHLWLCRLHSVLLVSHVGGQSHSTGARFAHRDGDSLLDAIFVGRCKRCGNRLHIFVDRSAKARGEERADFLGRWFLDAAGSGSARDEDCSRLCPDMDPLTRPNHALQRTAWLRSFFNRASPCSPSLSFGR